MRHVLNADGSNWIHEIKHNGYRMMARRDGAGIRLLTRNGHEHSLPGAFDLLQLDSRDLRCEPIEDRKAELAKLLRRAKPGLQLNEHISEPGDIVFRHACKLGLEGIVSKRLGSPYRSGRSHDWLKFKNREASESVYQQKGWHLAQGGSLDIAIGRPIQPPTLLWPKPLDLRLERGFDRPVRRLNGDHA